MFKTYLPLLYYTKKYSQQLWHCHTNKLLLNYLTHEILINKKILYFFSLNSTGSPNGYSNLHLYFYTIYVKHVLDEFMKVVVEALLCRK